MWNRSSGRRNNGHWWCENVRAACRLSGQRVRTHQSDQHRRRHHGLDRGRLSGRINIQRLLPVAVKRSPSDKRFIVDSSWIIKGRRHDKVGNARISIRARGDVKLQQKTGYYHRKSPCGIYVHLFFGASYFFPRNAGWTIYQLLRCF